MDREGILQLLSPLAPPPLLLLLPPILLPLLLPVPPAGLEVRKGEEGRMDEATGVKG